MQQEDPIEIMQQNDLNSPNIEFFSELIREIIDFSDSNSLAKDDKNIYLKYFYFKIYGLNNYQLKSLDDGLENNFKEKIYNFFKKVIDFSPNVKDFSLIFLNESLNSNYDEIKNYDNKAGRLSLCYDLIEGINGQEHNEKNAMLIFKNYFNGFQKSYFLQKIIETNNERLILKIFNLVSIYDEDGLIIFMSDIFVKLDQTSFRFLYQNLNVNLFLGFIMPKLNLISYPENKIMENFGDRISIENIRIIKKIFNDGIFHELPLLIGSLTQNDFDNVTNNFIKILIYFFQTLGEDQLEEFYFAIKEKFDLNVFFNRYHEFLFFLKRDRIILDNYLNTYVNSNNYELYKNVFKNLNLEYPELTESDDYDDFISRVQAEDAILK